MMLNITFKVKPKVIFNTDFLINIFKIETSLFSEEVTKVI